MFMLSLNKNNNKHAILYSLFVLVIQRFDTNSCQFLTFMKDSLTPWWAIWNGAAAS